MDIGINNVSRTVGQTHAKESISKLQPAEKAAEASVVSKENPGKPFAEAANTDESKKQTALSSNQLDLNDVANKVNELFQNESRNLQFNVDEASGRTVIKIVDSNTGEQIKQIPAEELLEISRKLAAQLESDDVTGMLVKSRA